MGFVLSNLAFAIFFNPPFSKTFYPFFDVDTFRIPVRSGKYPIHNIIGAVEQVRTAYLFLTKEVLYRLSYNSKTSCPTLMDILL